jgi:hypothetical protein
VKYVGEKKEIFPVWRFVPNLPILIDFQSHQLRHRQLAGVGQHDQC